MTIYWSDLFAAFGLLLVLEGLLPFLNPAAARKIARKMDSLGDPQLRRTGLLFMLAGVAVLFFAR